MAGSRGWTGVLVCLLCAETLWAQQPSAVPRLIKFSGQINPQIAQITQNKDNERAVSQSATMVAVTFSLYELQEGGGPLWSELQKVQLDEQGRYTVLLGATQPEGLPLDLFTSGKALWLGVQPQLPGATEQPRVLLVAVPYALKAADSDTLGGKPASAYALAGAPLIAAVPGAPPITDNRLPTTDNQQPVSAPQPGAPCPSVTSDGTATANSITMFTTDCNLEASAITQTSGNIGISGASPANTKFQITDTAPPDSGIHYTNHELLNTSVTKNGTNKGLTFVMDATNMTIPTGVTDSGYRVAVEGAAYTNTAGFAGTLGAQYGVWGRAGLAGATSGATVSNAYAGYFDILNSVAGTTITNAYGVFIADSATTGTITNRYDLYASSPNAKSYFAGNVGIGTTTPAAKLEVNGSAMFDMPVTFATAQTFTGNGAGLTNVNAATLGGVAPGGFIQNGTSQQAGANFNIAGSGTLGGILSLPATTSATVGVIDLGGNPFIHACCSAVERNTFVGIGAGNFTTTGSENTASGNAALISNTTGGGNAASGANALQANTTGSLNTASGTDALFSNTTGKGNAATGASALQANTTGSDNTAVGYNAGVNGADTLPTTGSYSTYLGANATTTADGLTNAAAIGACASVSASNALVLGAVSGACSGTIKASTSVGIGTGAPQKPLDVATSGGIRLSQTGDMVSTNEIFFQDNGQIRSHDDNHRFIFDRSDDIMELREFGSIVLSSGATSGNRTATFTIDNNGNAAITGNLNVNGSFTGNGSGLTNLNATTLGGLLPSAFQPAGSYATLGANTFAGKQTIGSGGLSVSNGNVGIGTSAPAAELNLNQGNTQNQDTLLIGNNSTKGLQLRDTGLGVDIESYGVGLFINNNAGQDIILNANASGNGGRVGVGTNSPVALVDVEGGMASSGNGIAGLQVVAQSGATTNSGAAGTTGGNIGLVAGAGGVDNSASGYGGNGGGIELTAGSGGNGVNGGGRAARS
ncbi:MAG: hypothetical protein ACLQOO_33955 [Terriglobia bacterium]